MNSKAKKKGIVSESMHIGQGCNRNATNGTYLLITIYQWIYVNYCNNPTGPYSIRHCDEEGNWGAVDLTRCMRQELRDAVDGVEFY